MSKPVQIWVYSAGLWVHLLTVSPARLGEVQEAWQRLVANHLGSVLIKAVDSDSGAVIAQLNSPAKPGQPHGWHGPN